MENAPSPSPTPSPSRASRAWLCAAFALLSAALGAASTWLALVPPAREPHPRVMTGSPAAIAACVAEKLGGGPWAGLEIVSGQVSIVEDSRRHTTRVMFEGAMRLRVVVTVRPLGPGRTEVTPVPLPPHDPSPHLDRIVATCAGG